MQPLNRPEEAPSLLRTTAARENRRRLAEYWTQDRRRRAQTSPPASKIPADHPQLVKALSAMSDGRCAFCEARDTLFVYRFRPSANALPQGGSINDHLYYAWLTDAWQNLLPICQGCIPPEPQFPVEGKRARLPTDRQLEAYVELSGGSWLSWPPNEVAALVDPSYDRLLYRHFLSKLDGELIGETWRGEQTVAVFNLNRPDRRHQRNMAFQDLMERLTELLGNESGQVIPEALNPVFAFEALEFGGSWYFLLRRLARQVASEIGVRWRTTPEHIQAFFTRLSREKNAAELLTSAQTALAREDLGLRGGRWGTGSVYSVREPIASIRINNFKAIESLDLKLNPPSAPTDSTKRVQAPSLVILGENATGKSSILEAIALTLTTRTARGVLRSGGWSHYRLDPSQMGLGRTRSKRRAEVEIKLQNGQTVRMAIDQGEPVVRSELGNHQVPVFAYGAFRRFGPGSRRPAPDKHIRNLFDASLLSNPEPWLRSLGKEQFSMVVRTLRDILSIEGDFDVIQRERGVRSLLMVTSVVEPNGERRLSKTPLHAISSGYRSMLAMICDIMRGLLDPGVYEDFRSFETAQGVVLIDEIEAHLHPRWKVQVMSSLRAALPGMTFIVTTHDPLCLRGAEQGEVVALQRISALDSGRDTELPVVVEPMEGLPPVADLRVEQLLTGDFFQLLSSDDAAADRRLAHVADLIAARARGEISEEDEAVLASFEQDISSALPVGSSEVHRMVQEAVATYLKDRREASNRRLSKLREKSKAEILQALETL